MDIIASLPLRRLPTVLRPDPARVLIRSFLPAGDRCPPEQDEAVETIGHPVRPALEPQHPSHTEPCRLTRVADRVLAMNADTVRSDLSAVLRSFEPRHRDLHRIFADRFQQVCHLMAASHLVLDNDRRLLIAACFSLEYSYQAAALFNPSMVPHPDQSGARPGEVRFVVSLRATGEGHVSSICFRSGFVDGGGDIRLEPAGLYSDTPVWISAISPEGGCEVAFPPTSLLGERVLFPITPKQRNGLEDARFVRFTEDDGSVAYYATYTAYSGHEIEPELLRTDDFLGFRFLPLSGDAVRNKGMALFPRRVGGQYLMLLRLDGETIQLSRSDDLQLWNGAETVLRPAEWWELLQIGNCGSPIELPEGWLVLTHGVGPMRQYSLGAALLDLDDPCRVLGRLPMPLLTPDAVEREGYVPNVVYSCGAMAHAGNLILPYGSSDSATGFAVIPLADLLAAMV